MQNLSYITLTFTQETNSSISNWLDNNINETDLYFSQENSYANGRVDPLHFTAIYGLDTKKLNTLYTNVLEIEYPQTLVVEQIEMYTPEAKEYSILLCKISLTEELNSFRKYLESLPTTPKFTPEFHPHISLAFVKNDFQLDSINKADFPREIYVESINIIDK